MKVLSIFFCIWAAANGHPYITDVSVSSGMTDDYDIAEDYNFQEHYNPVEIVPSPSIEDISKQPNDQSSYDVVEITDDDPVEVTSYWTPTADDDEEHLPNIQFDNNSVESSHELSYVEATTDEPGQENSFSINKPYVSADPLVIDDCEGLTRAGNNSVRTIITRSEKIHKCIPDLTRVLKSDYSAIIFLGLDAMDSFHLNEQNKLFFDKYYVLPKNIQYIRNYIYDDKLDIKVYVTSEVITRQLFEHLISAKYEEAVDLSKFLFSYKPDARAGREIITNVVNRLLKHGYETVMNFSFKLVANDAGDIVNDCFPYIFNSIFNEYAGHKILNKDNKLALNLSPELGDDNDNYRWLYSDCLSDDVRDIHWRFIATWNSTLESVVFEIRHLQYGSNLILDEKTIGHYNEERKAFGDQSINIEERQQWQLIPTNDEETGNFLFCIHNVAYYSYLIPNSGQCDKRDVRGMSRMYCDKEIGWNIKILGEN